MARIYSRSSFEVCDIILGINRDFGFGPEACAKVVQNICEDASLERRGRRGPDGRSGELDTARQDALKNFVGSIHTAIADGGPLSRRRSTCSAAARIPTWRTWCPSAATARTSIEVYNAACGLAWMSALRTSSARWSRVTSPSAA